MRQALAKVAAGEIVTDACGVSYTNSALPLIRLPRTGRTAAAGRVQRDVAARAGMGLRAGPELRRRRDHPAGPDLHLPKASPAHAVAEVPVLAAAIRASGPPESGDHPGGGR